MRDRSDDRLHTAQVQQARSAGVATLGPGASVNCLNDILGPRVRLPLALLRRVRVKHKLVARQRKVREPTLPGPSQQAGQFPPQQVAGQQRNHLSGSRHSGSRVDPQSNGLQIQGPQRADPKLRESGVLPASVHRLPSVLTFPLATLQRPWRAVQVMTLPYKRLNLLHAKDCSQLQQPTLPAQGGIKRQVRQ